MRVEGGVGVEVSHVRVGDGVPLWAWRGATDIPASPKAVFERLWHQRYVQYSIHTCLVPEFTCIRPDCMYIV